MSSSDPKSWLDHAKSDVIAARRLLPLLQAAYFVQQAAEKTIKARLVDLKIPYPRHGGRGHDLVALTELLPDADPMKTTFEDISMITPWAIIFRYPSDDPLTEAIITAQEVESRLDQIDAAIRKLDTIFQMDRPSSR